MIETDSYALRAIANGPRRPRIIAEGTCLPTDTSYGDKPATARTAATDLTVTPGQDQVECTTRGFGMRLLQGEKSRLLVPAYASTNSPG